MLDTLLALGSAFRDNVDMSSQNLTIVRPDDWHLHLRDGDAMQAVLLDTARRFGRAIVMPNLRPPVTTVELASAYRARILAALANVADTVQAKRFDPLMTLYLTDNMTPAEIEAAAASDFVHGVKLYPSGATTNSDSGVTDLMRCDAAIARMAELGLPLLVHGEVTNADVDVFDREAVFIDSVLLPLLTRHPDLRVVLEHITTAQGVAFVREGGANVAGTLTAHHLLYNRNAIFTGGIRPHYYCLPVLKREQHREALLEAATSGHRRFFLGTDSAPHARLTKEASCGCAGCYTSHAGIELYAEAFEQAGALDQLEAFASLNGPDWYGLPRNDGTITLLKQSWTVADTMSYVNNDVLVPLRAGEQVKWLLKQN